MNGPCSSDWRECLQGQVKEVAGKGKGWRGRGRSNGRSEQCSSLQHSKREGL